MQINSISQIPDTKPTYEKVPEAFERPEPIARVVEKSSPESPNKSKEVSDLQKTLNEHNITLNFSRDEKTQALVIRLVDNITGEAIIQIPTEVSLRLTAVNAKLQGLFVDEKS